MMYQSTVETMSCFELLMNLCDYLLEYHIFILLHPRSHTPINNHPATLNIQKLKITVIHKCTVQYFFF